METYQIQNLSFSYPEQAALALDSVSLTVEKGDFLVVCGPSGCGKSTFLRQLKTALAPHGVRRGSIAFEGRALDEIPQRQQAQKIGFVLQSPENQIVTDKVWHELAFGLESLGLPTAAIRRRVAEMACFFGIQDWFYKDVAQLSGGQKQLLNLASVMVMQPSVLILDEPTSQLDPIAAGDFLAALGKLNRELGTTVILTEHRLEEAFSLANRVAVLDKGRLLCCGTASQVGRLLADQGHEMFLAMPTAMRIWAQVGQGTDCPVTVAQGKRWLEELARTRTIEPRYVPEKTASDGPPVITAKELWFRYEKGLPDVVRGLSLTVKKGEFLAILGGNGAGKSTTLGLLAGLQMPYRGELEVRGPVGLLSQNPQALFVKKTVAEDLAEVLKGRDLSEEEKKKRLAKMVRLCRLETLLGRHPYDLSGGEQQRLALAKVMLLEPEILLLDEPTKGLDGEFKVFFAQVLETLRSRGVTVVMVSHDVEFCASYAGCCALFFDGGVVTQGPPRQFFSGNSFYTTGANRMARDVLPLAVTAEDVILSLGGKLPQAPEPEEAPSLPELPGQEGKKGLPWWRRAIAAVCALVAAGCFVRAVLLTDLTTALDQGRLTAEGGQSLGLCAALLAALAGLLLAVGRKAPPQIRTALRPQEKKLPKRTVAAAAAIAVLIPLTLYLGVYRLGVRRYYFVALLVLLECMAPFALIFEGRKPQPRELVVIAVLCALGVAGRTALFMLPQFKPVLALVIISGVALGAETGFLVGAVSMFLSNMLFSQGPWTPWQMFAMGLAGFLAGLLFRKGLLGRSRAALSIFGFFAAVFVYGGIMNPASMLMWAQEPSWALVLSYYVTGLPMDLVHGAATALFLWVAAVPMLEKLDRIKVKYGLVE